VAYEVFLIHIPEIFPGAAGIGKITENISFSIIASVIFYILAVYFPKRKSSEGIDTYIRHRIALIVNECKNLHYALISHSTNVPIGKTGFAKNEEITTATGLINPFSKAPVDVGVPGNRGNWFDLLRAIKYQTNILTTDLVSISSQVNPEALHRSIEVKDCRLFFVLNMMGESASVSVSNLDVFAESITMYTDTCKSLEKILQNKTLIN
jgi:hypothetical protein